MLLGVVRTAAGKTVIDFGSGEGLEAIESGNGRSRS